MTEKLQLAVKSDNVIETHKLIEEPNGITLNDAINAALLEDRLHIVKYLIIYYGRSYTNIDWESLVAKNNYRSFAFADKYFPIMKEEINDIFLQAVPKNNVKIIKLILEIDLKFVAQDMESPKDHKYESVIKRQSIMVVLKSANHRTIDLLVSFGLDFAKYEELIFIEALRTNDEDLIKLCNHHKAPTLYNCYRTAKKFKLAEVEGLFKIE